MLDCYGDTYYVPLADTDATLEQETYAFEEGGTDAAVCVTLLVPAERSITVFLSTQDGTAMGEDQFFVCLLYTSPSPRDATLSRMPSSA